MPEVQHPSRGKPRQASFGWDIGVTNLRARGRLWRRVRCYLPRWDWRGL